MLTRLFLFALLTSFASAAQVSTTAPSGAVYQVTAKGPVKGRGEELLGLSYLTSSLDDWARVADEASDLISWLLPELERGRYPGAVIMADTEPKGFILKTAQSYHSVYTRGPGGEWLLSKEGVADPALLAQLGEAYARTDAAFQAKDETALRALLTADFTHRPVDGAVRTLEQDLAAAKASMQSISSRKTVPGGFFKRKDRAFVMTRRTRAGEGRDAAGKVVRLSSTTTSIDTWLISGDALKLARSVDLEEKDLPLP